MLTVRLRSVAVQDPASGGSSTAPVPAGPDDARGRSERSLGGSEKPVGVPNGGVSVLSLSLLGLVKISWTKETP